MLNNKCRDFLIFKNNHKSVGRRLVLFFKKKRKPLKYWIKFDIDCEYKTKDPKNQKDINKLFGYSFGFHHKNSVRFGWRFNGEELEIVSYVYRDGKRVNEWDENIYIGNIECGKKYLFEIKMDDGKYFLSIRDEKHNLIGINYLNHGKKLFPIGYHLWPYFGGNEKAPKDFMFKICKP